MERIVYHVKDREGKGWEARREGRFRATLVAPTKAEALARITKLIADKRAQVVIHGEDGRIQEERTFPRSSDPRRSKG